MAGDWIKMRCDLAEDPSVIKMAAALDLDEFAVVGRLHRLWSWADTHTIDGQTDGVTVAWIDRFVALKGFAEAMQDAGWLIVDADQIAFPGFDRHNGQSAKKRAMNTLRQRQSRKPRDKRRAGAPRSVTPRPFVRRVLERDGGTCVYCGTTEEEGSTIGVDHITPLSRGGVDAVENLVSCCWDCNSTKNDRTPEECGWLLAHLKPWVSYCEKTRMVTDVSRKSRDKGVTREEKRRDTEDASHLLAGHAADAAGPTRRKSDSIGWDPDGGWTGISEADLEAWSVAYPAVDVNRAMAQADQWLRSNPAKSRKKAWRRFLTGWMSREQERGGGVAARVATGVRPSFNGQRNDPDALVRMAADAVRKYGDAS